IVQLILFIVDSGCTKHMTGNLSLLCNFVEKYLGTVRFGNDQFAPILGYGDLVQGNITINRVYYVEGLNHNLFSVGQFCDADLEVAFRKSTCFVRDLQGNDLLTGNRGTDLYTISLQETTSSTPICLMAKASPTQAWLWHRRLSHLNFDYINLLSKKDVVIGLPKLKYVKDQLCSSCEVSKAKRSSFKSKTVPSSKGRLNLLHMDLCGPMRVASINGKKIYSGTSRVNKSSSPTDDSAKQDTLPLTNIHPTTEPSTPTHVKAIENNNDQGINTNPFCTPDEDQTVIRNKARLVAKGYAQEEGIDFEESFAPVACLEAVRIFVDSAHTSLFQIIRWTRKRHILKCHIEGGGVMLHKPDGFVDPDHPEKIYRLRKALYGLKQAPRAWYDELSNFLISKGFTKAFSDPIMPVGIDTRKRTLEGILFPSDKLGQLNSKSKTVLKVIRGGLNTWRLRKVCSSNVDATQLQDYGFKYNKSYRCTATHSQHCNSMQHRATRP
ncbi:retrovirus-related pol polyprotein from transposon TNT 1-94, partial [Tanacetum coccineum]